MDQTLGGALDSLLGCSLPELSGRTLDTIYSPKVPGTQAAVPRSPGKPPGLAIWEIFSTSCLSWMYRGRGVFYCYIV